MSPEEREKRKREANVVMYGLSGDSPASLQQSAQEVFNALNLPKAGRHVTAVWPLPARDTHHPAVVCFDDPAWSMLLVRSKRCLQGLPAMARVYNQAHLTNAQRAEKAARQPGFQAARQLGSAARSCCTAGMPPLVLPLRSSPARGTGAVACTHNARSYSGTCRAAWLATTSMMHLPSLQQSKYP